MVGEGIKDVSMSNIVTYPSQYLQIGIKIPPVVETKSDARYGGTDIQCLIETSPLFCRGGRRLDIREPGRRGAVPPSLRYEMERKLASKCFAAGTCGCKRPPAVQFGRSVTFASSEWMVSGLRVFEAYEPVDRPERLYLSIIPGCGLQHECSCA